MNALHDLRIVRPATVDDAVRALAEDGAQALAGGTDLLPNLRRGLGAPQALVDLTAVAALDAIAVQADGSLRLGAAATLATLAGHAAVRAGWPALATAAGLVAGPTHREAATLGGNLCQDTRCVFYNQSEWWRAGNGYCLKYRGDKCHVVVKSDRCYATYHGDVAPALMALDASAEIVGPGGARRVPVAALFAEDGARRLTLAPGEWLAAVVVPPAAGWRAAYAKARVREAIDFPLAGAAVALRRDGDRLTGLRVAITGSNSAPLAVPTDGVVGRPWDAEAAKVLAKAIQGTSNVLATTVAPVKYRRRMLQALARRLVDALWSADTALHAVRMAFEIELGARAFYQRAAADTTDPVLRELFGRFAVMEGEHMETLARRYRLDIPDPSPDFRLELAARFAGVPHRPHDPDTLFRVAIALEQRAAALFTRHADAAAEGSAEHLLFRELAAEELEHAAILSTEFSHWQQGRPGRFGAAAGRSMAPPVASSPDGLINAAALLLQGHDAERVALVCGDQHLTHGELRDRVGRAAAVWRARGLERGHRVAIKLPDGLDWVVAFLGTIWAGGTAVAVNPKVPAPEWQYILEEAGFTLIVAESADDTPPPWRDKVIPVDEGRRAVAAASPVPPRLVDPETPAFWVHSSGTSGKPKAVVHPHRFAREIERVPRDRLGITADDRLFASSRLFFSYPQANSLWGGLKLGATVVLDPRWPNARSVAETVAATRPTVLFSVPSLYRLLLHEGLAPALAAAGLRCCVSAGEALPPSLRDAWRAATGLPMIDGYGASETLVLVLTAGEGDDGLMPSPGVAVSPLDPEAAADGRPTRLRFRLDTQAIGYLDRPAAQADSFRDGAFCPADLFVATAGGGWRFAGREDTLLKIKGRWVNLNDLEERLGAGLPGLVEAAAVHITDPDEIGALAYFYVAVAGQQAAVERSIRERCEALPHYQRPRWLLPVDTIPRTATGKLLRRKLAETIVLR